MPKQRKTRAALEAEIQKLIDEKKASEEQAATVFAKAFLTKKMLDKIVDLSDDEIKEFAKKIAENVSLDDEKTDKNKQEKRKENADEFIDILMTNEVRKKLNSCSGEVEKKTAENIRNLIDNIIKNAEKEVNIINSKKQSNREY